MSSRLRSSTRASTAASTSLAETMSEHKSSKADSTKSSNFNVARPLKKDELLKLRKVASLAMVAAILAMYGLYYSAVNDKIQLYPSGVKPDSLKGFTSRAEFALRYQTLLLFWLTINICLVIYARLSKKAVNPLVDSTEKHLGAPKNILTNSFEQIFISVISQLTFVSFADPVLTLKVIPGINMVQFFGRVAFFFGYPMYRTLGFILTFGPNVVLSIYNLYRLGLYLQFY